MSIATAFAAVNAAVVNWGKALYHRLHYTLLDNDVVNLPSGSTKTYTIAALFANAGLTQSEFDLGTLKVDVLISTGTATFNNSEGTIDVTINATDITLVSNYSDALNAKTTISVKRNIVP